MSTYHLITNNSKIQSEIAEYKKNVINVVNSIAYIWKMHNWSGNYENTNARETYDKKKLWKAFCTELTVRAGGETGRTGSDCSLLPNFGTTK